MKPASGIDRASSSVGLDYDEEDLRLSSEGASDEDFAGKGSEDVELIQWK